MVPVIAMLGDLLLHICEEPQCETVIDKENDNAPFRSADPRLPNYELLLQFTRSGGVYMERMHNGQAGRDGWLTDPATTCKFSIFVEGNRMATAKTKLNSKEKALADKTLSESGLTCKPMSCKITSCLKVTKCGLTCKIQKQ